MGTTIPAWQVSDLNSLASANELYGVPPIVLEGIDQAESSGSGGAINPEGYGGYFGLGANSTYPGGSSSPGLLEGTTPASFGQQAQLAASDFASLLKQFGGNNYVAEAAYQEGGATPISQLDAYAQSGEGPNVFREVGVPGSTSTAALTSKTSPLGAVAGALAGPGVAAAAGAVDQAVTGAASGLVGSTLTGALSIGLNIVFTLAGLGVIALGLSRLFPGVTTTITQAIPKV